MGRGALLVGSEQGASCAEVVAMPGVKARLGRRAGELLCPSQQENSSDSTERNGDGIGTVAPPVRPVLGREVHCRSQALFLSEPACLFTSQRMAMVLLVAVVVFRNVL